MKDRKERQALFIERIVAWVGSVESLFVHTGIFILAFLLSFFQVVTWELMLLVLTTLVSLEAIYLAIFIQITVNRHTESLKEVEEDIDEIQEDVEELGEDVGDIQEDLEEISEDIDEIQEDVEELSEEDDQAAPLVAKAKGKKPTRAEALERLTADVSRVLADLEALKKTK